MVPRWLKTTRSICTPFMPAGGMGLPGFTVYPGETARVRPGGRGPCLSCAKPCHPIAEAFQVTVVGTGGEEHAQPCPSPPFQHPGAVLWLRANNLQHNLHHTANAEAMAGPLGGMTQEGTCGEVVHEHESPHSKSRVSSYHPTHHLVQESSWQRQSFLGKTNRLCSVSQSKVTPPAALPLPRHITLNLLLPITWLCPGTWPGPSSGQEWQ